MFALAKLRESFMGYISPAKTPRPDHKTSPTNFLKERRNSPIPETVGGAKPKVATGRIVKKKVQKGALLRRRGVPEAYENEIPTPSSTEEVESDEYEPETEEDFETEVKIIVKNQEPAFEDDEPTFLGDDFDIAPLKVREYSQDEEESIDTGEEDLEATLVNDEESEVSGDDKVRNYLSNKSIAPKQSSSSQSGIDWHEDEAALWKQLEARGEEPILPAHWAPDFRTFTADFFSTNLEETFINSASGADFQGIRALLTLIGLGPRVRERRQAGLDREPLIAKAFNDYMKWAAADGGYSKNNFIPIHSVVTWKKGMSIKQMSSALEAQLSLLALHHRRLLQVETNKDGPIYSHPPPLLYGILIVRAKFIICTLDSALEGEDINVRTLAAFDFQETGMDVWNSFAVAIVVITIRNYMMQLKEMGALESVEEESDDPDL